MEIEMEVAAPTVVFVDEDVFDEALRLRLGWCPACQEFTTHEVEPRSTLRRCSECADDGVCGAAHARVAGFIDIEKETA